MRRISILNFKGGTGKTSLATNLSHALALRGARVLLVDCDLQSNASSILPPDRRDPTLTQVLKQEIPFANAIQSARTGLDVVPADTNLNTAATYITATGMRAYFTLRNAVKAIEDYDFVFFDQSPSYSPVTEAGLLASEEMLVPCELAPYAVTGLMNMITKLSETLAGLDHEVSLVGIVPFKLDQRYAMTERYLASLQKRFGERIIHPVRTDSTISRAQSLGQTVFEYDAKSKAAQDFAALATLLLPAEVRV